MNAVPDNGNTALTSEISVTTARIRACATNPPTQARISGTRPVSFALSIVPATSSNAGTTPPHHPVTHSVNSYGGAMPTQGNSRSTVTMPALLGLSTCRRRAPTWMRTTYLLATPTTAANAVGIRRSLAYNNIAQARPAM